LQDCFAVCALESDGAAHACHGVNYEADGFGWDSMLRLRQIESQQVIAQED
jgi:hypothetical protein